MNNYVVNLKDPSARTVAVSADGFDFPEEEWGHVLFYTGSEKDPTIVHTIDIGSILMIAVKPEE